MDGSLKPKVLIVIEDFINADKTTIKKIEKWVNSAREFGFTVTFLTQNHTHIPTQIRRNEVKYIVL